MQVGILYNVDRTPTRAVLRVSNTEHHELLFTKVMHRRRFYVRSSNTFFSAQFNGMPFSHKSRHQVFSYFHSQLNCNLPHRSKQNEYIRPKPAVGTFLCVVLVGIVEFCLSYDIFTYAQIYSHYSCGVGWYSVYILQTPLKAYQHIKHKPLTCAFRSAPGVYCISGIVNKCWSVGNPVPPSPQW